MASRFSRKDFLEALFGEYVSKGDGFVRVMTMRHMDRRTSTRYFPKLDTLAREQYPDNQHVFFGVCPYENMKPEKTNVRYLVALWAGLDLAADGFSGKGDYFADMSYAAKAVRSFPIPPSVVVESGWGVHLYWLLHEPTEITNVAKVEKLLTAINGYFQCRRDIGIDSMMRLPDTFNAKIPSNVVACTIKYLNNEFRYDLREFETLKSVSVSSPASHPGLPAPVAAQRVQVGDDLGLEVDSPPPVPEHEAHGLSQFVNHELADTRMEPGQVHTDDGRMVTDTPTPVATAMRAVPGTQAKPLGMDDDDDETVVVVAESSPDLIAEEIVDKVVARLTSELMDRLVDEIVEKLYQRITMASGNR
jgi:hypothetical protein